MSELEGRENAEGVWKAKYFEVSAKAGNSVAEVFQRAAETLMAEIAAGHVEEDLYQVDLVR